MKRKNIVIALLLMFTCTLLKAQSHNEEVTIEGSFTPNIKKSERIMLNPELPKHNFNIPDYQIVTKDFSYDYMLDLEPISPVLYNNVDDYDLTNNFVKVGIGTQLSPDFLFRHYSALSRNTTLGVGVAHNSTWLKMKDYEPNSNYMNNDFSVSMSNRLSRLQLHSYIDYDYDMYNLSYNPNIMTQDVPNTERYINSLNAKLLVNNNETSYRSLYDEFLLDYTFTGIKGGVQENLVKFKTHLEHSNSWFRKGKGIQTLSVDINADFNYIEQSQFLISINPYLAFDGEFYNLHLGFRADAKTNSIDFGGVYPDIKGSLYLFGRNLEFYAGLGGKTKINTLKEILSENPFIVSDITNMSEFDYEKTNIDFKGGLKFKILNKVSAHLGVRYRKVNNYIFYGQPSTFDKLRMFGVYLEDCNVFNFLADVHVRISDKVKTVADFTYNHFDLFGDLPWCEPKVEFKLRGLYNYNENWNFNVAAYVEGKRYILYDCEVEELKPICDIQLGCDYNLNNNLSFYGEVKNLIHNKYQMYYGYPSYGFQMFVGFKYRFL